jgi:hypothetical protein
VVTPPTDAALIPLGLPLFMSGGAVSGTALLVARSGDELYYLVDNAAVAGPPVWLHEGEVERCTLTPVLVRKD